VTTHEHATSTVSLASADDRPAMNATSQRIAFIAVMTRSIESLATGRYFAQKSMLPDMVSCASAMRIGGFSGKKKTPSPQ